MKNSFFCLFLVTLLAPVASAEFTRGLLVESLRSDLQSHYSTDGEWQVDLVRDVNIPAGTVEAVVAGFPSRPASTMILRVQFLGEAGRLLESNISVRAHLWRDAWLAGQPLTRGQSVDASQLDLQRLDILREPNAVAAADTRNGDYIYARSIPAGRMLQWRDLQRRPIVQRGQIVDVTAVDGGLSVVLKGMALENGARGELIRVRNLQSQREIAALVVGEGRTEISF